MSAYQVKNLEWVRGTTPAFRFSFTKTVDGVTTPVVFDDARFSLWTGARKGGALLCRYTVPTGEVAITDPDTGTIDFTMRADDTRACVASDIGAEGKNRYEIELRAGADERVYILGIVAAVGGANDDEG